MKLTKNHVHNEILNVLIEFTENDIECGIKTASNLYILDALLELKQRRAEDRKADPICQALNKGDGVYRP